MSDGVHAVKIAITASAFDLANLPPELLACELIINTSGRRPDRQGVCDLLAEGADGAIAGLEPYDTVVLESASSLRAVSRIGTGVDNIDLDAAERLGIVVLRTPDAPTTAVAELTVAFILAGLRNLPEHHRRLVEGVWEGRAGALLEGRTVGLIGAGRIARAVAQRLEPFGARVQATDPFVDQEGTPFPLVGLEELLRTSDVVSIHAPAQVGGGYLIDAGRMRSIRAGAVLINTARGGLVDEEALVKALRSGHLSFAALDAYEVEPYQGPLRELDNVLLTPHIGSNTAETRRVMEREAAANLALVLGLGP